jgi:hypothetical protein
MHTLVLYITEFFELILSPKFRRPLWAEQMGMREGSEYIPIFERKLWIMSTGKTVGI